MVSGYPTRTMGLLLLLLLAASIVLLLAVAGVLHQMRHPPRKTYATVLARGLPTDPADLSMTDREVSFDYPDRTTTPGWIIEGEKPDGPTVLLVHGFGDSRYGALTWAPLLAPFASHLVLFDLRGHGDATAPVSRGGVQEVDDVLGVIDQLEPAQRERGVVLFGYSMGGGIVIAAAAQERARPVVRGVVADGPYRFWQEPVAAVLRRRRYPRQPVLWLTTLVLRLVNPASVTRFDRAAHARRLTVPLLVLHGEEDGICPFASACTIAEAAPRGRLVEFPEGLHLDLAQRDPVRYRDALRRFFAELPPRPPQEPAG